jgi:hypothetical protein
VTDALANATPSAPEPGPAATKNSATKTPRSRRARKPRCFWQARPPRPPIARETPDDYLADERQSAAYTGLAIGTLRNWRLSAKHIPFTKLGVTVRYRVGDLRQFLAANTYGGNGRKA